MILLCSMAQAFTRAAAKEMCQEWLMSKMSLRQLWPRLAKSPLAPFPLSEYIGKLQLPASFAVRLGPCPGSSREECGHGARCRASLQCRREVLSSGPGASLPVLPSKAGPRPGSQLSLPKPCKFEHLGPSMGPGRRGRQGAKMLESCSLPAV